MPLKPKNVVSDPERKKVQFVDTSFFKGIFNDEYILVLGSGIILDKEKFPETKGDINQYWLNAINKDKKNKKFESLSDAVLENPSQLSPLYTLIIDQNEYAIDDISPELITLLKTRYFKYVFTTTPDHYVETLMQSIWESELRVVNFSDENSMRDFYDAIKASKEGYKQPTLFYVFGKAIVGQKNPTKFLETDNDAIKYIEEWIKLDNDYPLVSFLKEKRIFSIGCNYDDWYHRFFWHILTYNFTRDNNHYNDNAVLSGETGKLKEYLNQNNVCVHTDPWAVLKYINRMLTSNKFKEMLNKNKLRGKVFISYKTKPDNKMAQKVFDQLSKEKSLSVWYDDSSILGGQFYNKKIPMAIRFSQVFIPILTQSVADVLNSHSIEFFDKNNCDLPYFVQEWLWASEVEGIKIIPIAFEGYNLRGPEHQKFNSIVFGNDEDKYPSSIYMGGKDCIEPKSMDKLIESIRDLLGIKNL